MFALERVDEIKIYKNPISKLVINGRCVFSDFCKQITQAGNMDSDLGAIFNYLESLGNDRPLSTHIFKPLKGKEKIKDYELKKQSLRVYIIKHRGGYIIVYAGLKGTQQKDIPKMRDIKNKFIESLDI